MLLSTQLHRGALALPLLALFALLALTAAVRTPAQTASGQELIVVTARHCDNAQSAPAFRLALAPADLVALGQRPAGTCRT